MLQEVVIILILLCIFLHWIGILHYAVACIVFKDDSWVMMYRIFGMKELHRYRHSLFRAVTNVLTTGFGQGEPTDMWDMLVASGTIVIGALIRLYITGK